MALPSIVQLPSATNEIVAVKVTGTSGSRFPLHSRLPLCKTALAGKVTVAWVSGAGKTDEKMNCSNTGSLSAGAFSKIKRPLMGVELFEDANSRGDGTVVGVVVTVAATVAVGAGGVLVAAGVMAGTNVGVSVGGSVASITGALVITGAVVGGWVGIISDSGFNRQAARAISPKSNKLRTGNFLSISALVQ